VLTRARGRTADPVAAPDGTTASPAAGSRTSRRLIAAMLFVTAALDLARCGLVLMTSRHPGPAAGLVAAGIGAAALSITVAVGCRSGLRWAALAALLIGAASAPQASASGFHGPYTLPDGATAAIGILLTVTILAAAGRSGTPGSNPELPLLLEKLSSEH
jgi:hypothetical protein